MSKDKIGLSPKEVALTTAGALATTAIEGTLRGDLFLEGFNGYEPVEFSFPEIANQTEELISAHNRELDILRIMGKYEALDFIATTKDKTSNYDGQHASKSYSIKLSKEKYNISNRTTVNVPGYEHLGEYDVDSHIFVRTNQDGETIGTTIAAYWPIEDQQERDQVFNMYQNIADAVYGPNSNQPFHATSTADMAYFADNPADIPPHDLANFLQFTLLEKPDTTVMEPAITRDNSCLESAAQLTAAYGNPDINHEVVLQKLEDFALRCQVDRVSAANAQVLVNRFQETLGKENLNLNIEPASIMDFIKWMLILGLAVAGRGRKKST